MSLTVGCHLSFAKGYEAMGKTALSIGANTFAWFPRNPHGGRAKAFDPEDCDKLIALLEAHEFGPLVAHAPYTYNLCSAKLGVVAFARQAMAEDLQVLEHLPQVYYNFHPGSHVGQGADVGIELIAEGLNELLFNGMHTRVLLETMAGKGTEVGRSFEELARIIERVDKNEYLGVCLDTCHVNDAGYPISDALDEVLCEFDRVLGLERLCALHVNDSRNPRGSHKDRHECIGKGSLGLGAFEALAADNRCTRVPWILETPCDTEGYKEEIRLLKRLEERA